jgi:hypothetical protein
MVSGGAPEDLRDPANPIHVHDEDAASPEMVQVPYSMSSCLCSSGCSFSLVLSLIFGCTGFIFTGVRIGARNKVEGDPGNDAPREDPANSTRGTPPMSFPRRSRQPLPGVTQQRLPSHQVYFPYFLSLPSVDGFLLDSYTCLLLGATSTELASRLQETVHVESASDGSGEDSPARRTTILSSRASP